MDFRYPQLQIAPFRSHQLGKDVYLNHVSSKQRVPSFPRLPTIEHCKDNRSTCSIPAQNFRVSQRLNVWNIWVFPKNIWGRCTINHLQTGREVYLTTLSSEVISPDLGVEPKIEGFYPQNGWWIFHGSNPMNKWMIWGVFSHPYFW